MSSLEQVVTAVLLSLWRRGGTETTIQELLRDTRATLPEVQEALVILRQRRCLIEQTPTGVTLVATGLACWQDVLQEVARGKQLQIGRRVKVYQRTGSTNDVAWQFAGDAEADGLMVVADEQTAGRGRRGNVWVAKPEQSILLSLLLRERAAAEVDRMTLLAGLATAEAVEAAVSAATGRAIRVLIKWPNDLLIEGVPPSALRKLAGILVERRGKHVVVGIGINVAQGQGDFPPEVRARATSLYQATGLLVDRLRVVAALAERFDALCDAREDEATDDTWLAQWKSRCGMLGGPVTARVGNKVISGLVIDVDPLHGLMLRDETGSVQFLSAQTATLGN